MRLIWVDDDAKGLLSPMQLRFRRFGFGPILPFHFFEEATEFFLTDNHYSKSAILLDIILPSKLGKVSSYLGIELAKKIVEQGATRIGFLSVVFEEEIADDLSIIQQDAQKKGLDFKYKFFDKTRLVDSGMFGELVEFLKG